MVLHATEGLPEFGSEGFLDLDCRIREYVIKVESDSPSTLKSKPKIKCSR